jgi:hypothetical protein
MKAAISSMKGKHGDPRKKTEVPRKTLLDALEAGTELCNTEGHKFKDSEDPCQVITIKV